MNVKVNVFGINKSFKFTENDCKCPNKFYGKGVYILVNHDDAIIYVGVSNNLSLRMYSHMSGNTHTSYFSDEIKKGYYYLEDDEYNRDALEKLLIAEYRPRYNKSSNELGTRKYSNDEMVAVAYLLNTGKYSQRTIAEMVGVNQFLVDSVSRGKNGYVVDVPEGYSFVAEGKLKNKVDEKALEKAYILLLGGCTVAKSASLSGVAEGTLKQLAYGKQKGLSAMRERFEKTHGKLSETRNKNVITDEKVFEVFRLRFVEKIKVTDIPKHVNISQGSVSQILYQLQPRYKKLYDEFISESPTS